jgi:primosomal protein N'
VLDQEEVFNHELLGLARWMADFYSVSLSMVLSMIIPRLLHHKTSLGVIANVNREEYLKPTMILKSR